MTTITPIPTKISAGLSVRASASRARAPGSAGRRARRARSRSGSRGRRAQPVRNPSWSLNARRTKVAAPPVSGMRSGSLGVRERDEQEEQADAEQHPGREAERAERDDPEREEERRCDLAEGDRRQRGSLEDALQPGSFPSHGASAERYSRRPPARTRACRGAARSRRRLPPAIVRTTISDPEHDHQAGEESGQQRHYATRRPAMTATRVGGSAARSRPSAEDRLAAAHLRPRRSEDDELRVAAPCFVDDRRARRCGHARGGVTTGAPAYDSRSASRLVEDLVRRQPPVRRGRRRATGRAAPRSRAGGRSSPGARTAGALPPRAPPPTRRSATQARGSSGTRSRARARSPARAPSRATGSCSTRRDRAHRPRSRSRASPVRPSAWSPPGRRATSQRTPVPRPPTSANSGQSMPRKRRFGRARRRSRRPAADPERHHGRMRDREREHRAERVHRAEKVRLAGQDDRDRRESREDDERRATAS